MSQVQVTIALGSNLADPVKQIQTALTSIATLDGCELVTRSPLYKSVAMVMEGVPQDQPD